jgi:predicted outer membrane repeat protein
VSDSTFTRNGAYSGGGIYSEGTTSYAGLTVTRSVFSGNGAGDYSDSRGGGIYSTGVVTVSQSTFSGNGATIGGAIAIDFGTLTVSTSVFSDNHADSSGGGIDNGGWSRHNSNEFSAVFVSNSTFSGNSAGHGGGISNDYTNSVEVSNSTFSGNSAGNGGGIFNRGGELSVDNSTFFANGAAGNGGGIFNCTGYSGGTFNTEMGGNLGVANSFSGTVSNSTFSDNRATYNGGAILNFDGIFALKNTVVTNSPAGNNCSGTITDGGGNLSFPDTTCPGINADPLLGPLQYNGGSTWTMALGEGSAALDAGDDDTCAAPPVNNLDQRGVTRPQGLHCDIGAVEQIQEPSAVSVSGLRAQSLPGTITPAMVAGLLLLVLVAVGVQRRSRPIG